MIQFLKTSLLGMWNSTAGPVHVEEEYDVSTGKTGRSEGKEVCQKECYCVTMIMMILLVTGWSHY